MHLEVEQKRRRGVSCRHLRCTSLHASAGKRRPSCCALQRVRHLWHHGQPRDSRPTIAQPRPFPPSHSPHRRWRLGAAYSSRAGAAPALFPPNTTSRNRTWQRVCMPPLAKSMHSSLIRADALALSGGSPWFPRVSGHGMRRLFVREKLNVVKTDCASPSTRHPRPDPLPNSCRPGRT